MVLSEALVVGDGVGTVVRDSAALDSLRSGVEEPLLVDGLIKASQGLISGSEVLRALEAT